MGATLGTWLLTWLRGELVGADDYGNRYYRLKGDKPRRLGGGRFSRERRWVIYNGEPEGSKVPPEWHAWLHHMVNEVPQPRQRYPWEKPLLPARRRQACGLLAGSRQRVVEFLRARSQIHHLRIALTRHRRLNFTSNSGRRRLHWVGREVRVAVRCCRLGVT